MTIELLPGEQKQLNVRLTPLIYWLRIDAYPRALWITKKDLHWDDCRNSPTGSAALVQYGTETGFYEYGGNWNIYRGAIYFLLGSIPEGATILAANLTARFYPWQFQANPWWPNDHVLLDFPTHSWPIAGSDYGAINVLTDEIIRWHYTTPSPDRVETIALPQHTLDMMQVLPRLAIAEKCSADHDNVQPPPARQWGVRTYTQYGGYTAYIDVQIQLPEVP